ILMWFGILLLAYWSFMKTLDSLRQWLMPLLQPLQKKEDSKFFIYFLKSLLMALLSFSPQFTGALTWHSVAQGHPFYRGKLVQICLASLGGILTLGLLLPWTVIPGAFLIALGFGAVAFRGQKGFARFFLVSFFWGVFLFAM